MPNFVHLLTGSDPQEGLALPKENWIKRDEDEYIKTKEHFYEIETLQREKLR